MELKGKRVLVIGMGKTGVAAAGFLLERGAAAVVTDERPPAELRASLGSLGERCEVRPHEAGALDGVDLIIPSPGVPPANAILQEGLKRGLPVLSEVEVAFRFLRKPMIAITGTNGKTTVTTLLGRVLAESGRKVFVGGNIGDPLIGYVNGSQEDDFAVVEISSFQLLYTERFRPHVAVLLNTTYDHIDYHGSFEDYRAAKERIFMNQESGDLAVLNADEPFSQDLAGRIRAAVFLFSSRAAVANGIFLNGKAIRFRASGEKEDVYPLDMMRIPGVHNMENVMAVILAARFCGCPHDAIVRAVEAFRGIPHRIQFVGEKAGVAFYDDSKGTNVGAVMRALESFSKPTILLLGGRDKGGDFESLAALLKERVKEVVLFGEAGERIREKIGGMARISLAPTLKEAVAVAYGRAARGDVVLLSPGCSSFDEFSNYAERGRVFQETVKELPDG
jgi:UDP-N-acetylmuramoylalanine--D-glutamate ligase